jgi:predicted  nucleic acid-binding Zn-ribbon protein
VVSRLARIGELRKEAERASIRRTEEKREERVEELDESLEEVDKKAKETRKKLDDLVRQIRKMRTWQIARNEGDLTVEEVRDDLVCCFGKGGLC